VTGVDGKRSKLETETSTSTRSSSHEQGDRGPNRRISTADSDLFSATNPRSDASPPAGLAKVSSYPSKPSSPASHSLSGINSPRVTDRYSPISVSPRSATLQKESSFETHPSNLVRDFASRQSDPNVPYSTSTYTLPHIPSTTPPSASYSSRHQAPIDLPSRRSFREPTRLPPLTHEDTTLSSESSVGPYGGTMNSVQSTPLLPVGDVSKSMRTLPQPVPSLGPSTSPLDRHLVSSSSGQFQDYRSSAPLAALLRAGELAAREADDEAMDREDGGT
jgi:hypothetical protein